MRPAEVKYQIWKILIWEEIKKIPFLWFFFGTHHANSYQIIPLRNSTNHVFIFRCTLTCHTGECSLPEACKKKVKLYCPCKRKKQEMQCHKSKSVKLKCDEECKQILDQVIYY